MCVCKSRHIAVILYGLHSTQQQNYPENYPENYVVW